jgi:succinyl-diaminopimelate desuccinylase
MEARPELERLISMDTVSDTKTGRRPSSQCPQYIKEKLETLGFTSQILESNGVLTAFGRKGYGAFKILFLAHFDVVPVGEGWKTNPFALAVDGDRAYGRGSCDDKGNIVSLFLLAEKLGKSDPPCTMMIAATGDEELGGENGAGYLRGYLMKNGLFPDYVVVADGNGQKVIHRRRNVLPTTLKVKQALARIKGRTETVRFVTDTLETETRHSAYFRPGVDRHAMLAASKYLDLNPQVVIRGIRGAFLKTNVIPDWVELDTVRPVAAASEVEYDKALTALIRSLLPMSQAQFPTSYSDLGAFVSPNLLSLESNLWTLYCDVRAMTNDKDAVKAAFERSLKGKVDVYSLEVSPGKGYVEANIDSKLIRAATWALEKEGIKYTVGEGYGASDSRYFSDAKAGLFDFGPRGDNVHGANEWVSLTSIEENAAFFQTLLEVLSREKPVSGRPSSPSSRP